VDAKDNTDSTGSQGLLKVRRAGSIGRSDLHQPDTCAPKDLWNPHAAANLNQLTSRHDDGSAAPRQPDRESESRSVVRYDQGILGAGQSDEVVFGDPEPRTAPASLLIKFEIPVRPAGRNGSKACGPWPRGATEVRVENDACRVNDVRWDRQLRVIERLQAVQNGLCKFALVGRRCTRRESDALFVDHLAHENRERAELGHLDRFGLEDREQPLDARRTRRLGRIRRFGRSLTGG
jgi:hypothetical protein